MICSIIEVGINVSIVLSIFYDSIYLVWIELTRGSEDGRQIPIYVLQESSVLYTNLLEKIRQVKELITYIFKFKGTRYVNEYHRCKKFSEVLNKDKRKNINKLIKK